MRLRDFLDALLARGRAGEADRYRSEFLGLFCPPLSEANILDLSLDDVCSAASLLKATRQSYAEEARVFELKSRGYAVTYGEHYLRKRGILKG